MPYFYANLKEKSLTFVGELPPMTHPSKDVVVRKLDGWPKNDQDHHDLFARWTNESSNLQELHAVRKQDVNRLKQIITDYRAMWLAHKAQTGVRAIGVVPNLMRTVKDDKREPYILSPDQAADMLIKVDANEADEINRIIKEVPEDVIVAVGNRIKDLVRLSALVQHAKDNSTVEEYIKYQKKGNVLNSAAFEEEQKKAALKVKDQQEDNERLAEELQEAAEPVL